MATRFKGTENEVRALSSYIKLSRATHTASLRIHRHLKGSGTTPGQFGVLDALYFIGPLSQRELAEKHLMSPGNMTVVVDNLEKRGFVKRERGKKDRRFVVVHLTREGRGYFETVFPVHVEEVRKVMSALSPAEQDELGALCRKLGTGLGE